MAYNRTLNESAFSSTIIEAVWAKGLPINGYSPAIIRRDICGKMMFKSEYGNTNSPFGWEIDHIFPKSKGGSDLIHNLQPLQWQHNRTKGDTYPWYCSLMAA